MKKLPPVLAESPIFSVNQTSKKLVVQFDEQMAELELDKSQWRVLGYLDLYRVINQSELARLLGMSKAMMGQIVAGLMEKKWVQRRISEQDRRSYDLTLPSRTTRLGRLLSGLMVAETERILDGFTDKEMGELMGYLERIRDNIDRNPETGRISRLKTQIMRELRKIGRS